MFPLENERGISIALVGIWRLKKNKINQEADRERREGGREGYLD